MTGNTDKSAQIVEGSDCENAELTADREYTGYIHQENAHLNATQKLADSSENEGEVPAVFANKYSSETRRNTETVNQNKQIVIQDMA